MKRKYALIITGVAFAAIALVLLLVGGHMSGWDIAGFFTTTPAYILYFMAAFCAVALLNLLFNKWLRK